LIVGKSPLSCRYAQYASGLRYISNLLANGDLLFMEVVPWNTSGGDAVLSDLGHTTNVCSGYWTSGPPSTSFWKPQLPSAYPNSIWGSELLEAGGEYDVPIWQVARPIVYEKASFRITKTKHCSTDIPSLEAFPVPYWKITMNLSPWAPCLVSPTWLPTSRSWIWGTQSRKSVGENPASGPRWHTTTMTQVWKPKWRTMSPSPTLTNWRNGAWITTTFRGQDMKGFFWIVKWKHWQLSRQFQSNKKYHILPRYEWAWRIEHFVVEISVAPMTSSAEKSVRKGPRKLSLGSTQSPMMS